MSSGLLVFGDVFIYRDEEYIFLASTSDQIYAAKVLNIRLSSEIYESYKSMIRKNKEIKLRNLLYCFVVLTTQILKDRLAHLAKTEHKFEKAIEKSSMSLNKKDLLALKDEIVSSRGVPIILKELISTLDLNH